MTVFERILTVTVIAASGINTVPVLAGMVDPTQPPAWGSVTTTPPATAKKRGLQLQTTLVSPGRRMAIINGRSYSVGSRVGTATITEIKPFEVTLERAGKKTSLRLLPKISKSPVKMNKDKK